MNKIHVFHFPRQIIQKIDSYYADKNKRRKIIIIKDAVYVYIAYTITFLSTLAARHMNLIMMPYPLLGNIFLWISAFSITLIAVVLVKRTISTRFAKAFYASQFTIWLCTYAFWIYHLGELRHAGLLFALMAMVFLLPSSNLFRSYLLASSVAVVQVAVSCYSLWYAHQPGSLARELFFTLCFFPAALFINFLSARYSRLRENARRARHQAETARDVLWRVIGKTTDASGNSLHDALYLVNLIFEYCNAEGGCLFVLNPKEQRLKLVFSKLEKNSDIPRFNNIAEKAMEMRQAEPHGCGVLIQGTQLPPAHDDLCCISFASDHGSRGVCCLINAHMIGDVTGEKMASIRNILSCSAEILSKSPIHTGTSKEERTVLTASSIEKIEKAIAYIRENFTSEISRDGLASHLDISPNYFSKLFAEYMGKKMNDFIIDLRIDHATALLKNTDRQIIDVAFSVGFNNLRTFNRAFNKKISMTPQLYRKSVSQ